MYSNWTIVWVFCYKQVFRIIDHCTYAFIELHQVSIDVAAGWTAFPVGTKPPGPHLRI